MGVFHGVRRREVPLEKVSQRLSLCAKLIAPRVEDILSAAAGPFPFGFRRQTFACPLCVRSRVIPRYLRYRFVSARNSAGTFRLPPVCSWRLLPFAQPREKSQRVPVALSGRHITRC